MSNTFLPIEDPYRKKLIPIAYGDMNKAFDLLKNIFIERRELASIMLEKGANPIGKVKMQYLNTILKEALFLGD